jgi:hypothetical protein
MTTLFSAFGFVIACGTTDSVKVGTRSDGVTVYCNTGEYFYICTPDYPEVKGGADDTSNGGTDGGGDGSGEQNCNPDTYPCPDDGSDDGSAGDGSDDGSGDGSGDGSDDGGDACTEPWPVGTATVLWPPNHELHTYTLADCGKVDVCPDGQAIADGTITKITVDEAIEVGAGGDGHTVDYDARIIDDTHFELRSERQGGMDGRVYTVYYVDANNVEGTCQFLVPHSQSPFQGAVDSGTVVEITPP